MKGSVAVFFTVVIAAVVLWYAGGYVTSRADENPRFLAMYNAARAAREHKDIYTASPQQAAKPETQSPAPAPSSRTPRPNVPTSVAEPVELQSTDSVLTAAAAAAAGPGSAEASPESGTGPFGDENLFRYPPYLAIFLMPLSFASTLKTAALVWYWLNVLLFVLAMFFSMYAVSGTFGTGEKGLFLVPLVAAIPLIAFYLPTQDMTVLAFACVLAGLVLFRADLDVLAGLVSSFALFSPLGVVFTLYYLAKRAWLAVAGVVIGALVIFLVAPIVYFGPQGAWDETENYRAAVLAPLPAQLVSSDVLAAPENQSMWAMLKRNLSQIDELGAEAEEFGQSHDVPLPKVSGNTNLIIFAVLGVLLVVITFLGVWRKLKNRNLVIVGLEGALLVTALLLLSPYAPLSAMVVLIFPLFAVVYVIRVTDIRKLVHHVNYVGIVAATALFYMAFDARFRALGAAFAGCFILWVAVISAVSRFRPQLLRAPGVTYGGRQPLDEKPIEIVKARLDEEKDKGKRKKDKEKEKAGGTIPLPSFARSQETPPVPAETDKTGMPPIELEKTDEKPGEQKPPEGKGKISLE